MKNKEYQINIDPRILELLGPNLYTNIYYVLAELIANAYDAGANNVYIIANNNEIIVEDDGFGMSYDHGVKDFLHVAKESRTTQDNSYVKGTRRKKMGRKGVGKLAALSVSENVEVKTIHNGDKSGFILSRRVGDDKKLAPINEESINFSFITTHGTAIVMTNPQYKLHKTIKAAKNNLLKIFPLVGDDFKIHIVIGNETQKIESYEKEIVEGLGCLITLGDDFIFLKDSFDPQIKNSIDGKNARDTLCQIKPSYKKVIRTPNKLGNEKEYLLEIKGWIGAYRSSRGKKANKTDFPDNFISIISNKKLGEFNILPIVGNNALNEVYVVGQLHIDLFEETELPDMALSNRQGYKSDDVRYEEAISYIKETLLPAIVSLRVKYSSLKNEQQNMEKYINQVQREANLRSAIDKFKTEASNKVVKELSKTPKNISSNQETIKEIGKIVTTAINLSLPDLGLKSAVDDSAKKILISHSSKNKPVCDFIFDLLCFSGVKEDEIIYTSSESSNSRIPGKVKIYDYLRTFFVDSYSSKKIYVIYVTSEEMGSSWPAISEVGAGWITKSEHDIFNVNAFNPKQPLDIDTVWANITYRDNQILLSTLQIDVIAEKIMYICDHLSLKPIEKELLKKEIKRKSTLVD